MTFNESIRAIFAIASLAVFLAVACDSRPTGSPEAQRTKAIPVDFQKEKKPQPVSLPAQPTGSAERNARQAKVPSSNPMTDEKLRDSALDKIDWGRETALDEIIAMAKSGEIQQVEWHVMPNIIRAQAKDGRVFNIRKENKEIDIRNTLINAGIQIGKSGISLRYVF